MAPEPCSAQRLFTPTDRALDTIRLFLDDVRYGYSVSAMLPQADYEMFPAASIMTEALRRVSPLYRTLLMLLLAGHRVADETARRFVPQDVLEALSSSGLLEPSIHGGEQHWSMPGLAVVCCEGLYVVVSLPMSYPTWRHTAGAAYIGTDSRRLSRAYPASMAGLRVLDLCSGSGVQGLLCQMRGAASVTALDNDPMAVAVARLNARLNRLQGSYCAEESDLFAILPDTAQFDYITCNPPFVPVIDGVPYPSFGRGGIDGLRLVIPIFEGIPPRLAEGGLAMVICASLGDRHGSHLGRTCLPALAKAHGLDVSVYTHSRIPMSRYATQILPRLLSYACPEISQDERRSRIDAWRDQLSKQRVVAEYVHNHLVAVRYASDGARVRQFDVDGPHIPSVAAAHS